MIYKEREKKNASTGQSLMGGAMVLTVALIVTKIVGAIYSIPQKAILDLDGAGVYSQAYDFYTIIYAIAVTGFPAAISKVIIGYTHQGRYNDIKRTVRIANIFFLVVGITGSLLLVLLAKPYSVHILENENVYYSIIAVAPSIIFSCLMSIHRGYNQGMRNMIPTAVSQVVEVVVKCIIGLTAAYVVKAHFQHEFLVDGTVLGRLVDGEGDASILILSFAAAGSMLGVTFSTFAGWVYMLIRNKVKGDGITAEQFANSPAAQADKYLLRQILIVGVPAALGATATALTSFLNGIVMQRRLISALEKDVVAVFASHGKWMEEAGKSITDEVGPLGSFFRGCYSYGFSFFNLIPAFTGSFNMSALPHIADAWLIKDRKTMKRHMDSTFKITMLIAAPLGFGLVALGTPILHFFYSASPARAAIGGPILRLLGFAAILLALYSVSNTVLQAIGRFDLPMKILVVGGALNIAMTYVLVGIPSLNIKLAPLGMIASYLLIAVLSLSALSKNTDVKVDYRNSLVKPLLAGAICGLTAFIVYELQILLLYDVIRQKIATAIAIVIAAVVYLVAISLLKVVTKEDVLSMPKGEKMLNLLEKLRIVR